MKIRNLLIALLIGCAFTMCKKDLGNYDYGQIPDLHIDTAGTPRTYTIRQGMDELSISPTVTYNGNNTLEYYWIRAQRNNPTLSDTIATTKDIHMTAAWAITGTVVPYSLFFQVIDRETGDMDFVEYVVHVTGAFAAGLMVGHEKDGTADFDFIATPTGDESPVTRNLYEAVNGSRLPGTVTGIGSMNSSVTAFMTDQSCRLLTAASFQLIESDRDVFGALNVQAIKPQAVGWYSSSFGYMINDGQVYSNFTGSGNVHGSYMTQKITMPDRVDYYLSPFYVRPYMWGGAFFDELNKRMVQVAPNFDNEFMPIIPANPGRRFSLDNINKKLLGLDRGYTLEAPNSTFMAVFADLEGGANRYLYVMNLDLPATPDLALVDITHVTSIQDARYYASLLRTPVVYYSTADKVYMLQVDAAGNTVVEGGAQFTAPGGEEITHMYVDNLSSSANPRCYIATYNPTTGEGKVYLYIASSGNGLFRAEPAGIWTGFDGKITKMNRKTA